MYPALQRLLRSLLPAAAAAALLVPSAAAGLPAVPQGYTSPFSDVRQGAWYYPYVSALNHKGVIAGYDSSHFGPQDAVRTGDAVLMVLKAAGCKEQTARPGEHYAAGYLRYAVKRGWLTRQQTADPEAPAPRLLLARLAAQALGLEASGGKSPFADVKDGLVTALYREGIVAGTDVEGQRLFQPDSAITRAELSAILWRVQGHGRRFLFEKYALDRLEVVPACTLDPERFVRRGDRMTYTGSTADLGVDVSYHNGTIDWKKVAADGISFAMIRAGGRYYGSGGLFEDTQFRRNIQGALDAGLEVGVYFFSQAVSAQEGRAEARFLLKLLEGYGFTGPVVFDWENIPNDRARTDGLSSAVLTQAANAFCQEVEQAGYAPMIYFNRQIAYLHYDLEGVAQYPFWLAEYGPSHDFQYDFHMWQYTDAGRVAGIQGPVDLNIRVTPF